MLELAVSFGPGKHLSGTLALPDELGGRPVGFIMLNAGVIHRIGPHRFNVRLARALADQGWPSLRFDLAGQGDSDNAPQVQAFERQIVADLRAAMDHLGRTAGVERFVIAGICSGAHRGLAVAQEDERVIGLVDARWSCLPEPADGGAAPPAAVAARPDGHAAWLVRLAAPLAGRAAGPAHGR
ncbi:MAG: alpha/beta hydrolase [Piscinibacter sp.]